MISVHFFFDPPPHHTKFFGHWNAQLDMGNSDHPRGWLQGVNPITAPYEKKLMRLILVVEVPQGDPDVKSHALSNAIGATPQGRPAVAGATG
jgi:hypothetical protein